MWAAAMGLVSLLAVAFPGVGAAPPGVVLEYAPPVGQVAEYRVTMDVRGAQVAVDESEPVSIRAELEVREEVVGETPEGGRRLRVSGRAVRSSDPSGTFARGTSGLWPEVEMVVSRQGEVVSAWPVTEGEGQGPLARAFAARALGGPRVVFPAGRMEIGHSWQWKGGGAQQTNTLVGRSEEGGALRVVSEGTRPVVIEEGSAALGVRTTVSGEESYRVEVELEAGSGVVKRSRGEMRVVTRGETTLVLPEGERRFPTRATLRIEFQTELVRLSSRATFAR